MPHARANFWDCTGHGYRNMFDYTGIQRALQDYVGLYRTIPGSTNTISAKNSQMDRLTKWHCQTYDDLKDKQDFMATPKFA